MPHLIELARRLEEALRAAAMRREKQLADAAHRRPSPHNPRAILTPLRVPAHNTPYPRERSQRLNEGGLCRQEKAPPKGGATWNTVSGDAALVKQRSGTLKLLNALPTPGSAERFRIEADNFPSRDSVLHPDNCNLSIRASPGVE